MGRTGNLREYLSSISTTIANTSGGDKDKISPSELFKRTCNYLINFSNLEAIITVDIDGTTQTSLTIPEDFSQFVPLIMNNHLLYITLQYKNNWLLSIAVSELFYIESQQRMIGGGGAVMFADETDHISYMISIEASSSEDPNVEIEYRLSFGNPPDGMTTFVVAQELVEH